MKKATVAHVGHTGTSGDAYRTLRVLHDLAQRAGELDLSVDRIDLNNGRDFLAEDKQYDIVVLHFLYNGRPEQGEWMMQQFRQAGVEEDMVNALRVSPLSSWSAWVKRLENSGARFIYAFGGTGEVSGGYLCVLKNYKVAHSEHYGEGDERIDNIYVFERIEDGEKGTA